MADTIVIETPVPTVLEVSGLQGPQGPAGASQADVLTTQGDLLYRGASAAARLAIGTAGQVLKVSGGIPAWQNESGGVPTSRTITAGTGLTGGGDLSANRTLAVSYGTTAGTACQGNDGRIAGIESGSITTGIDDSAIQSQQIKIGRWGNGTDSQGGFIDLRGMDEAGGSIDLGNKGTGGYCGTITMHDGAGGHDAGNLNTSGGLIGDGGSINTSNGGGSIDTRGTGSIEFGSVGTRTTLTGTATADRAVSLPNAAGTLALTSDITKTAVGLGNVTNNAQTQAAIVPNTAPTAGQLLVGNAGGTAYAPASVSGDATIASTGVLTLANTSTARTNIGLGNVANVDTTNAANISSGTLDNARVNWAAPSGIGSTTPSTGAFTTLNANNGTITASAPVLDLSQTWNNASVTFTALKIAVTNTASASTSALADFAVGAASMFSVTRTGSMVAGASAFAVNGASGNTGLWNGGAFGWSSSATATSSIALDTTLFRDSANTLAQRNGTNAQTFRLYSTFTSATNFERLNIIAQSAASVIIGTEKGSGGGTARGLELRTDNTARITIGSAGQLGFFGASAAAQPTAVADATDAATVITQLNALLSRMRTLGLIAT